MASAKEMVALNTWVRKNTSSLTRERGLRSKAGFAVCKQRFTMDHPDGVFTAALRGGRWHVLSARGFAAAIVPQTVMGTDDLTRVLDLFVEHVRACA